MNEHDAAGEDNEHPVGLASSKRGFLKFVGAASVGLGLGLGAAGHAAADGAIGTSLEPRGAGHGGSRRDEARRARIFAANEQRRLVEPADTPNGDETALPGFINSYSKGLAHNDNGEVSAPAFQTLVRALQGNSRSILATVAMGTSPALRQVSPFLGYSFSLAGPDPQGVACPPPPTFSSQEAAAEMVELYWLALTRDVPFAAYADDPRIAAACADLNAQPGYRGPRNAGRVTPANIFRGTFVGELDGPLLSQFLLRPIPHGAYEHEQRLRPFVAGNDFQITSADWLLAQRGGGGGPTPTESTAVYQRNGRDLSAYLLADYAGQPALEAALILNRAGVPANPELPVPAPNETGTFGGFNQFLQLVGVATAASLAPCFYQKWQVHRRARPDAYGGRVHRRMTGQANYPIAAELLDSAALASIFSRNGNYYLPMGYRVGCPPHPSYPAAHAVSVAAGVTMLKALYRGDFVLAGNKVPSADGQALLDYTGALTVEGELNKLAANVALGRDTSGVHFRSDGVAGIELGEKVALFLLAELRRTQPVSFPGFTLRRFDGTQVTV